MTTGVHFPDTTRASLLHRLFRVAPDAPLRSPAGDIAVWVLVAGICYGALVLLALIGPVAILPGPGAPKLPFLTDYNVAFMLLVSLPAIVVLTLKDQQTLTTALDQVRREAVIEFDPAQIAAHVPRWTAIFTRINIGALVAGATAGAIIAAVNYVDYRPAAVGFWIAHNGRLLPVGYGFLAVVFLFYLCVCVYVARSVAIAWFLRELVSIARLRIIPFHPDHCGGLRPVGWLGLRNQYLLTIIGLNVVLLAATVARLVQMDRTLHGLVIAACAAYVVLGPVVFMAPLLSFRSGMRRTKVELIGEVAHRLRRELERIRANLESGPVTDKDEELVLRLRSISRVLEKLPVWPFDVNTLKKFLMAYIAPLASGATLVNLHDVFDFIAAHLPGF